MEGASASDRAIQVSRVRVKEVRFETEIGLVFIALRACGHSGFLLLPRRGTWRRELGWKQR